MPRSSHQFLSVPKQCRKATRAYMRRRGIDFTESYSGSDHHFKLSRHYRPHAWKVGCPCEC